MRRGRRQARTGGVAPYFAAGNTEGDLGLLESSSALRLVVSAIPAGEEYYATEMKMLEVAQERGWYWHRYR